MPQTVRFGVVTKHPEEHSISIYEDQQGRTTTKPNRMIRAFFATGDDVATATRFSIAMDGRPRQLHTRRRKRKTERQGFLNAPRCFG